MIRPLRLLLLCAVIGVTLAPAAEPPAERIVRVSFVDGDASYQRGDADGWDALGMNTPMMTGDSIYTARGGRAEVSLGQGNFARFNDGTQVDLTSLTPSITQLGVSSGEMSLRVRSVPEGGACEIDTPFSSATIIEPGLYRVFVDDQRATYEVLEGAMSVATGGEQLDVHPKESLTMEGIDRPTYEYTGLRPADRFDEWAAGRDQRAERPRSAAYVHSQVEGQEDLDASGTWRPSPEYGQVWVPSGVGPDWAPYQDGRWIWQDPYGWTWVSYESWGWAPYHYGRWVNAGGSWAWVPPPPAGYVAVSRVVMPEPVYAPALVGFIGGSHWSIGVSVGGGGSAIGWVPLAPSEQYYYPWQPAPRVVNHYTNVTVVNAVTVVQQNNFVSGGGHRERVDRRMIAGAPTMGCRPEGVAPTPDSLAAYPHRHLAEGAVPMRRERQRPLQATRVPPPRPVPFHQKAEMIRKTGRPVERPVDFGGDVGKPYSKGVHAPSGVNAVSAYSSERPASLSPRGGKSARAPHRIDAGDDGARGRGMGRPAMGHPGPGPSAPSGTTQPAANDARDSSMSDDRSAEATAHSRRQPPSDSPDRPRRVQTAGVSEPIESAAPQERRTPWRKPPASPRPNTPPAQETAKHAGPNPGAGVPGQVAAEEDALPNDSRKGATPRANGASRVTKPAPAPNGSKAESTAPPAQGKAPKGKPAATKEKGKKNDDKKDGHGGR